MLARLFLFVALLITVLITACQDTSQTNNQPTYEPNRATSGALPNPSNSPNPVSSPQTSTLRTSPETILKQEEIKIGAVIPEITTSDITGKTTIIAARTDKTGQLVMVYGPSCPVCHETMPNV
ncbi:MAG: hypothetical protein FD167_5276, partial [bacterium]